MGITRNEALIREKLQFFRKSEFWPLAIDLDPEGWLRNFADEEERTIALALLDGFLYLSPSLTSSILERTFQRLSREVSPPGPPLSSRRETWTDFRRRVIITYPTDEEPGATDSGRSYLRKARGVLGLEHSQFADPSDAVDRLSRDPSIPLVLIDDFVGTGSQILATWRRGYSISDRLVALEDLQNITVIYIPVLCTSRAIQRLKAEAPSLLIYPGHIIGEEYSIFHRESILLPPDLRNHGVEVVRRVSERTGIPMGNGESPNDWCGFGSLGLAVALDDTIPDASLTLFYWEEGDWCPLKRRP